MMTAKHTRKCHYYLEDVVEASSIRIHPARIRVEFLEALNEGLHKHLFQSVFYPPDLWLVDFNSLPGNLRAIPLTQDA